MYRSALLALLLLATGCSWVTLDQGGSEVDVLTRDDVAECEKVGIVTATTKSDIGFNRNPEKVRAELEILARNQAASMGGNAIVVRTPAAGGNQTFDAYRCQP